MAERAKGIYRPNITYGDRDATRGHWIDRLPAFDEDIADLRKRLAAPVAPANTIDAAVAVRALARASARVTRPSIAVSHMPEAQFRAGQPLSLQFRLGAGTTARRVVLYYRHVNQAARWQSAAMVRAKDVFSGVIPAAYTARRYPLQYYFEIETGPAEATLFPPLAADLANVPYFVIRRTT